MKTIDQCTKEELYEAACQWWDHESRISEIRPLVEELRNQVKLHEEEMQKLFKENHLNWRASKRY